MLGRFLEISVHAPNVLESLEFYQKLGFTQAQVGEAWAHPYAVVSDGRLFIGLHQYEFDSPSLTFVKPDLSRLHRHAGEPLESSSRSASSAAMYSTGGLSRSGPADGDTPGGAHVFSADAPAGQTSSCGYFNEIGIPARNPGDSKISGAAGVRRDG